MGKPNHFWIEITNKQPVYYVGQMIYGTLYLSIPKNKKARSVKLTLKAFGRSHWSTSNGQNTQVHTQTVNLLEETTEFWKSDDNNEKKLPAGNYSYPFKFQLGPNSPDNNLPSSFEYKSGDTYGRVRYLLYAVVDRPWRFDHKTQLPLTVMNLLDCNMPIYVEPSHVMNHTKMIARGEVDGIIEIERKAYCPGDTINGRVKITNHSTSTLSGFSLKISQKITLKAQKLTRTNRVRVHVTTFNEPIKPKSEEFHQEFAIVLPNVSPSINPSQCKVVNVEYFVKLTVKTPALAKNLRVFAPFVVGTIRFINSNNIPSVQADDLARLSFDGYSRNPVLLESMEFPVQVAPEYNDVGKKEPAWNHDFSYQYVDPTPLLNNNNALSKAEIDIDTFDNK